MLADLKHLNEQSLLHIEANRHRGHFRSGCTTSTDHVSPIKPFKTAQVQEEKTGGEVSFNLQQIHRQVIPTCVIGSELLSKASFAIFAANIYKILQPSA